MFEAPNLSKKIAGLRSGLALLHKVEFIYTYNMSVHFNQMFTIYWVLVMVQTIFLICLFLKLVQLISSVFVLVSGVTCSVILDIARPCERCIGPTINQVRKYTCKFSHVICCYDKQIYDTLFDLLFVTYVWIATDDECKASSERAYGHTSETSRRYCELLRVKLEIVSIFMGSNFFGL